MICFRNLRLAIILSYVNAITDPQTSIPPENRFQLIDNVNNTPQCNCVNIERCDPFVRLLKQNPTAAEDLKRIQDATCGFLGIQPYVCCPEQIEPDVNNTNDSNKTSSVGGFSFDDDNTLYTLGSNDEHVPRPSRGFDAFEPNNQNVPQNGERKITTVIKSTISTETIITSFFPTTQSNISHQIPTIEPRRNNDDDLVYKKTLFPDNCGVFSYSEQFGDFPKDRNMFPWVARLGYREKNVPEYVYRCGGVLINKRYVLTSAYCTTIHDQYKLATIRLGEYDSRVDNDCESPRNCNDFRQDFRPEKVTIHEDYNSVAMQNDIAVIRLDGDVHFTIDVKPICLPFHLKSQQDIERGSLAVVAGWGITDIHNEASIPYLQYGLVQITEYDSCVHQDGHKKYSSLCIRSIMEEVININDNGGPLMIEDKLNDKNSLIPRYYALGIALSNQSQSNKSDRTTSRYYRIYTPVRKYIDWILYNVNY